MFPKLVLVIAAVICAEIKQLGAEPSPNFRVSPVDAGRPIRFKFRPQPMSSFQHVSSGYGSPARYFHPPRQDAPRTPSYYFASLNGGSIFPETLFPEKDPPSNTNPQTNSKAFSPIIGVRALSNLEQFFQNLRENVEAVRQEEDDKDDDEDSAMQNDMDTNGGMWGAAPSTPYSGATALHRRTPPVSKETTGVSGGNYDGQNTIHSNNNHAQPAHGGHPPIFFPAQSKFHGHFPTKQRRMSNPWTPFGKQLCRQDSWKSPAALFACNRSWM